MDKDRRRIPSQSSNSVRPGISPVHGGYTSGAGDFTASMPMNQHAIPMHYNNVPPSRQQLPPPGFGVQNQNGMNMYPYPEPHHQSATEFHGFNHFITASQEYAVNEKFGIPGNAGYSNFYPQENLRHSSIIGVPQNYGGTPVTSVPEQQQYNNNEIINSHIPHRLDNNGIHLLNGSTSQHPAGSNNTYPRQIRPDENSNKNKVISPLIENFVGSMSMSNGTYTHFGPAMVTQNFPSERATGNPYGRSELRGEEDILESLGASLSSLGSCGSGKESPIGVIGTNAAGTSVRASTPNDGMDIGSRPQTPGKPSYSEILAKNASQNGIVPCATSHRKLSSTSLSPVSSKTSVNESVQSTCHQNHRKSTEHLNMSSNSSAASSSCASASSSPVAKQKLIPQSIVGRLFNPTKGKENNTGNLKTGNSVKVTPSNTPTHQKKCTQSGQSKGEVQSSSQQSNERKILSSSENHRTGGSKSKSSAKATTVSSGQSSFEFEIEDLDEKSDWGWKTYTSRGKNHTNRPTNANSNYDKRYSEENFGIVGNETEDASENNNDDEVSDSRRESLTEKRSGSQTSGASAGSTVPSGSSSTAGSSQSQRKSREKEKAKIRRDDRNCAVRRVERMMYLWAAHMISAAAWLLKLVTDVLTLSISVGSTLMEDFHLWWINKALPICFHQLHSLKDKVGRCCWKVKRTLSWRTSFRRPLEDPNSCGNSNKRNGEELLAALGPERNIALPCNGDEALKRLLSVKGQDPYSILGIRSDSSDETIRRYYKKQAVLVHPDKNLVLGAEEAFKILARAFELIGEPLKRAEYHHKLLEAHAKEKVYGEIGKLLEQLRKKMEIATSSIRCTKCNSRHKKNKTDRPLFAARYCAQCGIHHGAREGELWAERNGWFGLAWNYFACMDCHVWEINEWAKCQKKNLHHIKPDSHCVMYRLVAGNGNNQQGQQQSANGNSGHSPDGHFHVDPEDDWDSLINNLCKSPGGVPGGGHFYQQGKGASNCCPGGTNAPPNTSTSGKKRKGKRK